MKVLVAEDSADIRFAVQRTLTAAGYLVEVAETGEDAAHLGETGEYDAVVLDLGLPTVDGLSVLAGWRSRGITTPVLILTARGSWREKVRGLRTGADDYLTKPFQAEELLARLEALIRRSKGVSASQLKIGELEIDLAQKQVVQAGTVISLTAHEYRTLVYLGLNRGRVISQSELTEHLYAQEFERDSNVIEVTIARLRKKLGKSLIETRRGHGYLISGDQ